MKVEERVQRITAASFQATLAALREGSEAAVWEIIEQYEPHIRRVVRRKLSPQLRSKFDTMDFVQMVWKSFFETPEDIHQFVAPQQLAAFLVKIAKNKVETEHRRRIGTLKYDVSRERPLDEEQVAGCTRPADRPSQIAIARERWDDLVRDLPDRHRKVVQLRVQGMTFEQIAERLGISERTPRRVLKDLLSAANRTSSSS